MSMEEVSVSHSGPIVRYQQDLQRDDFSHDPAQEKVVQALQAIYENLEQRQQAKGDTKNSVPNWV